MINDFNKDNVLVVDAIFYIYSFRCLPKIQTLKDRLPYNNKPKVSENSNRKQHFWLTCLCKHMSV